MENSYEVWALCKGLRQLSASDKTRLKQYFSSRHSGGESIRTFESEETLYGTLLRIEFRKSHVVGQVLSRSHNLASVLGYKNEGRITDAITIVLSRKRAGLYPKFTQNEKNYPKEIPSHRMVSENSVLLVSNLTDVDHQLLAHWIKTITGIWPISCHINRNKDKAIVTMPSTIDISLFGKARREDYFLRGSLISVTMLQQTNKMLAEFNKDVQREHQEAIRLYFSSAECGLTYGQMPSIVPLKDSQKAFIITYSEHEAIQEIVQRVHHKFMGYIIEVGEFYTEAGYLIPRDLMVFPCRKIQALPTGCITRLIVENVSTSERSHFELLMKNQRMSKGDKSAQISYRDKLAYLRYSDPKVTYAVFEKSEKDGIFLNKKRLDMDLDTTELTSAHDPRAVRLSRLPQNIDPDRLKFHLSDISENLVISLLFQENGDRAVARFRHRLGMKFESKG